MNLGARPDVPLPNFGFLPIIVLIRTSHPGNLGAVCRAMLNFGFTELRLVDPHCEADEEARKRAKFAGSILDNVGIFETWDSCMHDIGLVIGTSGKKEGGLKTSFRHLISPEDAASKAVQHAGKVAIVFGEEGVGLTTPELDLCDLLMTINTWEGYPICNLSHAVALILYDFSRDETERREEESLTGGIRSTLKEAISDYTTALSYEGTKSRMVGKTLDRIIMKGLPNDLEAQQLIGALVEATTALQKVSGDEEWKRGRRRRLE